jgi:phospholipase/carboxylesterase
MIVALHWSSSTPEAMLRDLAGIPVEARILLPQANYPQRGGWSWFPRKFGEAEDQEARAEAFRVADALADWIELARREYPTYGRPVVTGISYGGDLAYLLAVRHPRTVRAAFPVAARFPADWIPEARTCTDDCPWIVAFHGNDDWIVGLAEARETAARLRARGYPVELRSYAGVGHRFSAGMRTDFEREVDLRFGSASRFARVEAAAKRSS